MVLPFKRKEKQMLTGGKRALPPLKKKKKPESEPEPEFEDEEIPRPEEEQYYEEERKSEPAEIELEEPVDKTKEFNKEEIELELELLCRRLADIEMQLRSSRIWLKNENNLNGICTEQDLLGFAADLKYKINVVVDKLRTDFNAAEKDLLDMFNDIRESSKKYEYWLIDKKK